MLPFCCLCMCFMSWKPLLVLMQLLLVHQSNKQTENKAHFVNTRNIVSQLFCNKLGIQTLKHPLSQSAWKCKLQNSVPEWIDLQTAKALTFKKSRVFWPLVCVLSFSLPACPGLWLRQETHGSNGWWGHLRYQGDAGAGAACTRCSTVTVIG